jgi:hypothetical protein
MGLLRSCWFSSVGVPEQPPDVVKHMAITVAEEAVIPDLDKAFGQDVLHAKRTPDELFGTDGAGPSTPSGKL